MSQATTAADSSDTDSDSESHIAVSSEEPGDHLPPAGEQPLRQQRRVLPWLGNDPQMIRVKIEAHSEVDGHNGTMWRLRPTCSMGRLVQKWCTVTGADPKCVRLRVPSSGKLLRGCQTPRSLSWAMGPVVVLWAEPRRRGG